MTAAFALAASCASGYAMVASFSVSNPERLTHWRTLATIYFAEVLGGMAMAFGAVIYLLHQRRAS